MSLCGNIMREEVFAVVRAVPRGKVITYGDVANACGHPRCARAVGRLLHTNDNPETTPCHRVVFANGSLADAYVFGGADVQRARLESEGVTFTESGKVNMRKHAVRICD